jgi:hypothetical protein
MQELPHGLPLTHCGFLVSAAGTHELLTRVAGHVFRLRICSLSFSAVAG